MKRREFLRAALGAAVAAPLAAKALAPAKPERKVVGEVRISYDGHNWMKLGDLYSVSLHLVNFDGTIGPLVRANLVAQINEPNTIEIRATFEWSHE